MTSRQKDMCENLWNSLYLLNVSHFEFECYFEHTQQKSILKHDKISPMCLQSFFELQL